MSYNIELSRIALKSMGKIPKKDLVRIGMKIDQLSTDPQPIDMKKIQGGENLYRIRSGDYRILYRIFNETVTILVVDVDHRKDVYKKY